MRDNTQIPPPRTRTHTYITREDNNSWSLDIYQANRPSPGKMDLAWTFYVQSHASIETTILKSLVTII